MATFANPFTLGGIVAAIPLFLSMGAAAAMMSNETVESFERISKAITSIPTKANLDFQTSMKEATIAVSAATVAGTIFGIKNQAVSAPRSPKK